MTESITLYHGTSDGFLSGIMKTGLLPRHNSQGNFLGINVPSHPDLVYMKNDPFAAEYYAVNSALVNNHSHGVVLTIDTNALNKEVLRVDENLIDLEEIGQYNEVDIERRNESRKRAKYDKRWKTSLKKIGSCSHLGKITSDKIVDVKKIVPEQSTYFIPGVREMSEKVTRSQAIKAVAINLNYISDKGKWGYWNGYKWRYMKLLVRKGTNFEIEFENE